MASDLRCRDTRRQATAELLRRPRSRFLFHRRLSNAAGPLSGMSGQLFVSPPREFYTSDRFRYGHGHHTYTSFNYLGSGPITRFKRHRFEIALGLTREYFGRGGAIDLGCADGVLIPSLSKHFPRVAAVDSDPGSAEIATQLVDSLGLKNVRVVCNAGMTTAALRLAIGDAPYQVLYMLETLEHVGQQPEVYASKITFVEDALSLLEPGGVVVISVPKMVGIPYLLKYGIQSVLQLPHEHQDMGALLRAGLLKDTEASEAQWNGGHLGFNNAKLQRYLRKHFTIARTRDFLFSQFYVIRK